jgi:hypothetical protein
LLFRLVRFNFYSRHPEPLRAGIPVDLTNSRLLSFFFETSGEKSLFGLLLSTPAAQQAAFSLNKGQNRKVLAHGKFNVFQRYPFLQKVP